MRKDTVERTYNVVIDGLYKRKHDGKLTYEGKYHHAMWFRCYGNSAKKNHECYTGCSVSDNFKDFQFFAKWCNNQQGFGQKGFVLDKDILIPHNKIYSETACVFIPDIINSFFTFSKITKRELPVGVSWCETEGKYKVYCAQLNGRNKTIGRFNSVEAAHESYCLEKERLAKVLAEKFKGIVDNSVIDTLLTFKVKHYIKEKL